MRIAVVSDTHLPKGRRQLPARLVEVCTAADLILHAGDFSALSCSSNSRLLAPVQGVLGNTDDDDLAARLPVEFSPSSSAPGVRIGMVHNSGRRTVVPSGCASGFRTARRWCSATPTCRSSSSTATSCW